MLEPFKIDTYAVVGHPVKHSKSPFIHTEFAKQMHQTMEYLAIEAPLAGFTQTVRHFQQQGGKGLNITVPFKQQAFAFTLKRTPRAKIAGAVNTIIFNPDGSCLGDNTDGAGLIHDLQNNLDISIKKKKILIIGAGGAVRGIIAPLLENNPLQLFIVNRTVLKAKDLAKHFAPLGLVHAGSFLELKDKSFDIIINATTTGLTKEALPLPPEILKPDTICYDLAYDKEPTAFLRWASEHGAKQCYDGLGMLVEQAAESFFLWRDVKPDTKSVIALLKKQLAQ